jgi:GT2 family glycosyltransferase
MSNEIGVVVIGRNEGDRLRQCLSSVVDRCRHVVYVDSGSTDDSVAFAKRLGVDVVALDLTRPFTAARSRNEGFRRLEELDPAVRFVQFVDGDCEVADGWLAKARRVFDEHPEVVVVCGRRRERDRGASVYNRLTDMEWDTPVGDSDSCGGDAMIRADAFREVGGFNPALIAGEEPELCFRLRQRGGRIRRLDAEMTVHDAALTRFGQWWKRSIRAGYAYALCAALHGRSSERFGVRENLSNVFWGAVLPVVTLALAWPTGGWSLVVLLGVYALQAARVAVGRRSAHGDQWSDASVYGAFCILGKFAQLFGLELWGWHRLKGRGEGLIEYKT